MVALQVSHAQPASAFITPASYPSRTYGGMASQVTRVSFGAVVPSVTYSGLNVHVGAQACNGDVVHDSRLVLSAACDVVRSMGKSWSATSHIWMQTAYAGTDITECALSPFTSRMDPDLRAHCAGAPANAAVTYSFPADGSPTFAAQAPDGGEYTVGFTHEVLHAAPHATDANGAGLADFTVSHDGLNSCAAGQVLSVTNPACLVREAFGQHYFLSQNNLAGWANSDKRDEPATYKVLAGWLPASVVQTLPPGTTSATVYASDVAGHSPYVLRVPRPAPLPNGLYHDLLVEFRSQMWVGGCPAGGTGSGGAPPPPCMTVNVPGAYVLVVDNQFAPGSKGHVDTWAPSTDPSDTTYYHEKPLRGGVTTTLEPGVTVKVTGQSATSANVVVTY